MTNIQIVIESINKAQADLAQASAGIRGLSQAAEAGTTLFGRLQTVLHENASAVHAFQIEMAGIVTGLILAGKHAIEAAAELGRFAERTGISVEQLSAFAKAGKQFRLTQEDLNIAFRNFA